MHVRADLSDATIDLGNKGVSLKIADNEGKHVGTLRIGRATVEWRKGRTQARNAKKIKLEELIDLLNDM